MLWEGLRLYSRSQYAKLGAANRFILTEEVREKLHPDIPEMYLNKSIILIETSSGTEIEVEGNNFLAVDDSVPDFTFISMREAERRYPSDVTECRLTGSTLISKLYQDEQDALLKKPKARKTGPILTAIKNAKAKRAQTAEDNGKKPSSKPIVTAIKKAKESRAAKDTTEKKPASKPIVAAIKKVQEKKASKSSETEKKASKPAEKKPASKPIITVFKKVASKDTKTTDKKASSTKSTSSSTEKSKKKAAVSSKSSVISVWKRK